MKPIAQVGRKRASRLKRYTAQRKKYLADHPECECKCGRPSIDIHHKAGRIGYRLLFEGDWLAVCRPCHVWIHAHPSQSRAQGFLK